MDPNICPVCNSGRLQKRAMTYIEWYGKDLLVINRMPTFVCSVCDEQIYDQNALENLQQLLWATPPQHRRVAST